jgi:hypothetical protein
MIRIGCFELQQGRQDCGSDRKQSGTDRRLGTLQIESAGRLAITENDAKQLLCFAGYFFGDFFEDRFGSFFFWVDGAASATGRRAQIRSLISSS